MNITSTHNNLVEINCEAFGFPKPNIKLVKKNSDGKFQHNLIILN